VSLNKKIVFFLIISNFTACKQIITAMLEMMKKAWPYVAAVVLFIVLSFAYFSPVLEGEHLPQMDETHAQGMAKELVDHEAKTGEKAMWTNSMFGGMPAYQIKGDNSGNMFSYLNRAFRLGLPFHTVAIVFLYLMGFYVLLLSMRVDKWLSLVGAIAFAFGSYNLIIIIAGHITKAYAIALMAPVLAAILFAYNRNKYLGALFTAIALGMEIAYNHVQITYYLAMLVLVLIITRFIVAYKDKAVAAFVKTTAWLGVAVVLAILPNISNLWTTSEYGKFSIRGKSELSATPGQKEHSGLDKDYALAWSYGKKETLTLLIPNVVGGASESLANSDVAMEQIDPQFKEFVAQSGFSQYWGGRPFTSGPVYAGAIVCFLFFLGAFLYKGKERWWLIAGTLLSLFLAWGKNFPMFTDLMFYYFPLYNKFRTVEMALVIASLTIPVLGFLGLREIYERPEIIRQNSKWFLLAVVLTGGLSLLLYVMPSAFFNFMSPDELSGLLQQKQEAPQMAAAIDQFISNLRAARTALLKADAIRSFFLIILASGSIWLYSTNKLGKHYLTAGLALLIIIDLWTIDKRYLNEDHFTSSVQTAEFTQSPADKEILKDTDPYYRVFTVYRNPFTEVNTSYYHKSIGGYHGAKLRRYQDLIDRYLQRDLMTLNSTLQKGNVNEVMAAIENMQIVNMLNTKYIIFNPNTAPIHNPFAMGNAWFVSGVKTVATADEEIETLAQTNLRTTAVLNKKYDAAVTGLSTDSVIGKIVLEEYRPDYLKFSANTNRQQLAVFSDIYYPAGWNAYVDGQQVEILQANYVLRALVVPQGTHTIEFRFEPQSFNTGKTIAYAGSVLLVLLFGAYLFIRRKKCKKEL
jgi:hypothetical protein